MRLDRSRVFAVILFVSLAIVVTGCTNPFSKQDKASPEVNSNNTNSPAKIDPAKECKIQGIDLDIGSSYKDVIDEMGTPKAKDWFEGSYYMEFEDITFFLDGDRQNARVMQIAVFGSRKVGRIRVGMKQAEIKDILGLPTSEGEDEDKFWVSTYNIGDREMQVCSQTIDAPVMSIVIQKKN
ncbi:MAG: DUF4309 domain-containing protein [Candidatus Saccharibacteria bacterium]